MNLHPHSSIVSTVRTSDNHAAVKGEMALWRAVITQALQDAGSRSAKYEARHEKARAIRWLLGSSDDFTTVCLHAGMEPEYVREQARAAIARGCTWRNGADKARKTLRPLLQTKSTRRAVYWRQPAAWMRASCEIKIAGF